jgi:starch-binding outer membrane protein, SusD/RagB family
MLPVPTFDSMILMRIHHRIESRARRCATTVAATALALAALAACDLNDALRVDAPSRIPADALETPVNAILLVNSTIGDFECAYGAYTAAGALIGEESVDGIQTADRYPYDRRSTQPSDRRYAVNDCTALGTYVPLQTARVSAENVLGLLNTWTDAEVPNRAQHIATTSAHAGYALLMLGEGFCQAVISSFDESRQPVLGGIIARDSVLKLAEARFTAAITSADASIKNMALLGRAKARQNLGRLADARADAILVPANFVRNITASATPARRQNKVWADGNINSRGSLVGEPYRSMTDPRVRFAVGTGNTGTGIPVV